MKLTRMEEFLKLVVNSPHFDENDEARHFKRLIQLKEDNYEGVTLECIYRTKTTKRKSKGGYRYTCQCLDHTTLKGIGDTPEEAMKNLEEAVRHAIDFGMEYN